MEGKRGERKRAQVRRLPEEGNTTQQVIVGGEGEGEEGNTTQQVINESPYTLRHLCENGPNIALETG